MPAVDIFFKRLTISLLGASELESYPPETALFPENGKRAESITTVQGDGVIEDMKNAHEVSLNLRRTFKMGVAVEASLLCNGERHAAIFFPTYASQRQRMIDKLQL